MQTQIDYYENKIEQAYRNEKAAVDENSQLKDRIAELEETAEQVNRCKELLKRYDSGDIEYEGDLIDGIEAALNTKTK